ncbi:dihydroneopterin aldolase [Polymorphobacter multimanifer]|nr:dihydroneopterin aldolase [Polymorphobacter multimanifer]
MIDEMPLVALAAIDGLVPEALRPRSRKIMIEGLELELDIGFHAAEIGVPQRLLITIEVWVTASAFASHDVVSDAWDYHVLRDAVTALAHARRFNLQETLAQAIYDLVAARQGVLALRVSTRKPDVYPDCEAAGVEIASFATVPTRG